MTFADGSAAGKESKIQAVLLRRNLWCSARARGESGLLLLMKVLLYADLANMLLAEARAATGLSQTDLQICYFLSGHPGGKAAPLTPAEIARSMGAPRPRVVNQLTSLAEKKLIVKATDKVLRAAAAAGDSVDGRAQYYALTKSGHDKVDILLETAAAAEKLLFGLTPKKVHEHLDRLSTASRSGLLESMSNLEAALGRREIGLGRRDHAI